MVPSFLWLPRVSGVPDQRPDRLPILRARHGEGRVQL
jgi:hypothetical protein